MLIGDCSMNIFLETYAPSFDLSPFFFDSCPLYVYIFQAKFILVIHREKELAAVKINAADVDIIANELEVTFLLFFHAHEHISNFICQRLLTISVFVSGAVGQEGGRENLTWAQRWCCCCHSVSSSLTNHRDKLIRGSQILLRMIHRIFLECEHGSYYCLLSNHARYACNKAVSMLLYKGGNDCRVM